MTYQFASPNIIRQSDGALMRSDISNEAWLEYQAWLAADNEPSAEQSWTVLLDQVLAAGITTFLKVSTSDHLRAAMVDSTGTGALVFNTGCGLTNIAIGAEGSSRAAVVTSAPDITPLQVTTNTTITNNTVRGLEIWAKTSGTIAAGLSPLARFYVTDPTVDGVGLGGIGFARRGSNVTGDFIVRTSNAGVDSENLRVTAEGNVGIGTTTPTDARLVISGTSSGGITGGINTSGTILSSSGVTQQQLHNFGANVSPQGGTVTTLYGQISSPGSPIPPTTSAITSAFFRASIRWRATRAQSRRPTCSRRTRRRTARAYRSAA